mmetsp:Transcript_2456/g.8320  ORF Transcript_2456/g.8320 Transcript_2456/m.8320 type:complete len:281 (+) Transcript_2456:510-1352(+)
MLRGQQQGQEGRVPRKAKNMAPRAPRVAGAVEGRLDRRGGPPGALVHHGRPRRLGPPRRRHPRSARRPRRHHQNKESGDRPERRRGNSAGAPSAEFVHLLRPICDVERRPVVGDAVAANESALGGRRRGTPEFPGGPRRGLGGGGRQGNRPQLLRGRSARRDAALSEARPGLLRPGRGLEPSAGDPRRRLREAAHAGRPRAGLRRLRLGTRRLARRAPRRKTHGATTLERRRRPLDRPGLGPEDALAGNTPMWRRRSRRSRRHRRRVDPRRPALSRAFAK